MSTWNPQKIHLLLGILFLLVSLTFTAHAVLTVSNSGLFGDADVAVDGAGTLNLGTASSTAVVIGNSTTPVTIPGSLAVNGTLTLGSASTNGQLLFKSASSSFSTLLQASSSHASNLTFTLPTTAGTVGQAMLTDGIGNLYFGSSGSSQWVNGANGVISYNVGSVTVGATTPTGSLTSSLAVAGNVYAGDPTAPKQLATLNATINVQPGTSYTLTAADNGKVLTFNNASNVTLTIPSGLGAGFNCLIVQLGAGTVTPTSSATTILQRQSLTQTAGQYAIATLVATSANTFILSGDLQ